MSVAYRSTCRPTVGQTITVDKSTNISTDVSINLLIDISTDISRSISWSSVGRHIDWYIRREVYKIHMILLSLPYCLEMYYVFSITSFMINGIIQGEKLVNQVYYLHKCQKYNTSTIKRKSLQHLQYWVTCKLGSIISFIISLTEKRN